MEQKVNLAEINDIKELKVFKSDQYDVLEAAQRQLQQAQNNIAEINARISELLAQESKQGKNASSEDAN
jgi:hypothetical protein